MNQRGTQHRLETLAQPLWPSRLLTSPKQEKKRSTHAVPFQPSHVVQEVALGDGI